MRVAAAPVGPRGAARVPWRHAAIVVLAGVLLAACAAPKPLPLPERQAIPFGQGRVWQVDRPGLQPSYLFGTIHVNDPRVLKLPEAAEAAFESAEIAAFEAGDMSEPDEKQKEQYFKLPEGESLSDLLGFWTYHRLTSLAAFRFFTLKDFDRLQPWVVWMFIADREVLGYPRADHHGPILDDWLYNRAKEVGKEVVVLETAQEQWAVFTGMPMDDQVSMLRSAIDTYYGPRTEVDRLQIYLDGDLEMRYALWRRFLGRMDPAVAERFDDRIGAARNRTMAERLMPVFARGSTFVAVGAMHLPGEQGMLRLLEQQGFTVTRLQ